MRILVVDSIYEDFAADLYDSVPDLRGRSHDEQLRAIWDTGFGTSDAYVRALAALGHETAGVITNWVPLQDAWLREHPRGLALRAARGAGALGPRGRAWREQRLLLAQVEEFGPDVVVVQDLMRLGVSTLDALRSRVPLVVGQISSRTPPLERLRRYDLLLTSFPHFVERFREAGVQSELVPLAFDSRIAELLERRGVSTDPDTATRRGVVFVGGLSSSLYARELRMLEQLAREIEVDVWGYGEDELSPDSPLRARFHGRAWGLEMYELLAGARVVVNRHSLLVAEGYANNMRLFEATGSGAALVTEAAPNLSTMFEPGLEVATYSDGTDLTATVAALLEDDDGRRRLASAGQRRTMADHTYEQRAQVLAGLFEERLAAKPGARPRGHATSRR